MGFALASVTTLTMTGLKGREGGLEDDQAGGWVRRDMRILGMSFDFPAHIFSSEVVEVIPEGVVFYTPDRRAKIGLFSMESRRGDTPRSVLNRAAKFAAGRFTYTRTTPRFFAASGTRGDLIFYRRCNVSVSGEAKLACVHVDYPRSEKRAWDDVITRISLSLRTTK